MSEELPEISTHTVTCHADGCSNADASIELAIPAGGAVACGVCGNVIDDVDPPTTPPAQREEATT